MQGGEVFVPKLFTIRILDLVKALKSKPKFIGIRSGEKIHETLCVQDESNLTLEFKDHFSVVPSTMINLRTYLK